MNKLARAITKWTRACDKRSARLIYYIHHTCEFKQNCNVGNTAQQCRLGLFQDSDFARDPEDSKSTSGGILCIFGSHTFVPISWMCKRQTSVSHCSTEAEIISLDAGLGTDGIPAPDLRFFFNVEVFHCSQNQLNKTKGLSVQGNLLHNTTSNKHTQNQTKVPTKHDIFDLFHVGSVPSNVTLFHSSAMLYVFEDNEAVIKMIITGRSPTMRHVSRTHRVASDWLFDGINLDPKIQIKCVDTKHQLADILTKGNFTRDEWNNLLHLFNISHVSLICCAKNFSLTSCTKTMAKRMQEQKQDNRIVAKSKPTAMNLAVTVSTSSSSVNSPIASKRPGVFKASGRQIWCSGKPDVQRKRNSNPHEASSSQGWPKDALLDVCTGKPVATDKDQESLNYLETLLTGKLVAPGYQGYPGNPGTPGRLGNRRQNLATSSPYITRLCTSLT